jgi:hypothetical protein
MGTSVRLSYQLLIECVVLPLAIVAGSASRTFANDAIVVWRVGSPVRGDTPSPAVPIGFRTAAERLGFDVTMQGFPAAGFAAVFAEAVARNAAPDVLAFDNFEVMVGAITARGRVAGIGDDPTRRSQLIRVTGTFDQLLAPTRGWTYLFTRSPHHAAAYQMGLQSIPCLDGSTPVSVSRDVHDIASSAATAYFAGDTTGIQSYADPDRLAIAGPSRAAATVDRVTVCGSWGNGKLSIVSVDGVYEGAAAIGRAQAVLVLRHPSTRWQLLVIAGDPMSIRNFVSRAPQIAAQLSTDTENHQRPAPARLLAPSTGDYPTPGPGQRFGDFVWQPSPSEDVVVEIAEFVYQGNARLIMVTPSQSGAPSRVSAGQLFSGSSWIWRVWSVSRNGEIALTESRTFMN